jgi:hypothetical protein
MRCIGPGYDPARDRDFYVTSGPAADAFDLIIHHRRVTSVNLLY